MAITFEKLQELLRQRDFRFFVASDRPVLRAGVAGLFGQYEFAMALQDEGQFLQFRTLNYLSCPEGNAHLATTLRVLAHVNYIRRGTKFGWDPSDGEIAGYADTWLMDNDLTAEQLTRIMGSYLQTIDIAHGRIKQTLETGKDPGDPDPAELMRRVEASRKARPEATESAPVPGSTPDRPRKKPDGGIDDTQSAEPSIREI